MTRNATKKLLQIQEVKEQKENEESVHDLTFSFISQEISIQANVEKVQSNGSNKLSFQKEDWAVTEKSVEIGESAEESLQAFTTPVYVYISGNAVQAVQVSNATNGSCIQMVRVNEF